MSRRLCGFHDIPSINIPFQNILSINISYNRDHKEENRKKLFSLNILIGKYNFGMEEGEYFL